MAKPTIQLFYSETVFPLFGFTLSSELSLQKCCVNTLFMTLKVDHHKDIVCVSWLTSLKVKRT